MLVDSCRQYIVGILALGKIDSSGTNGNISGAYEGVSNDMLWNQL